MKWIKITTALIIVLFIASCNNERSNEKELKRMFLSKRQDFQETISYLDSNFNSKDKNAGKPRLSFYKCNNFGAAMDYRVCDSVVNEYLTRIEVNTVEMVDNSCFPEKKYDLVLFKVPVKKFPGYTYYIQFSPCLEQNKNFENNRIKIVNLDKEWAFFIEK